MNTKFVTSIAVMLASFPIVYIIPITFLSVSLLSMICAAFIGNIKLWKVSLVFIPMYLFLMRGVIFSLPSFVGSIAQNVGLTMFFWVLPLSYFCLICELTIFGLLHLLFAKYFLKKTGVTKRLGGLIID